MSKIAGDFSCADLQSINVKIEEIWADAAQNKDYIAEVEAARILIANQSTSMQIIEDPIKDRVVHIQWLADCAAHDGDDCVDDCIVGGPEIEVDCRDYTMTLCHKDGFSIAEKKFRGLNIDIDQVIAMNLMTASKGMDEWITRTLIAMLDTFAGVNQYSGGIGTPSGFDTFIPASYWTGDLMAELEMTAIMNHFKNYFMLSGSNLWTQAYLADAKSGNAEGKGAANLMARMKLNYDLFNMDQVLGTKKTFVVERSAYAFVSKNYFTDKPREIAMLKQYRIPSRNLPGIFYDVTYKAECLNNDITHNWSLQWYGDLFQNPLPCAGNPTGVLTFVCGAAA